MSEMIERVSEIINRSAHCDWRLETCRAGDCQCKVLAREIIESMQEPTKDMVHAGCVSLRTQEAQDQLMAASLSSWPFDLPRTKQRIRFRAMIAAALGLSSSP